MWSVLTTPTARKALLIATLSALGAVLGWKHWPFLGRPLLALEGGAGAHTEPPLSAATQVSIGQPVAVSSATPSASPSQAAQAFIPAPPADPQQENARQLANKILQLALHQSVWGPPAWCTVRQQIDMFDQQLSSFGDFIREGQGSGKLKLKLQFPAADTMNSLLQISDGQRLQTIENLNRQWHRKIIDLDKVRNRLIINDQSVYDPTVTLYLAIGGQAESLRKLCQQYDWHSVTHGRYGDQDVWLLSGQLTKSPHMRAHAETDTKLQQDCSSGLMPTSVRVAIGKTTADNPLAYWLYQVEHRREGNPEDPIGRGSPLRLVTEWSDPQPIQAPIPPTTFEATTSNELWSDETEAYLPPHTNLARVPMQSDAENSLERLR